MRKHYDFSKGERGKFYRPDATITLPPYAESMQKPAHPGWAVRNDCLVKFGLTVKSGAKALGVSRQALTSVLSGRAGISPEMAVRLEKAFGGSAETWLLLQVRYNLAQVLKSVKRIHVERQHAPQELHA